MGMPCLDISSSSGDGGWAGDERRRPFNSVVHCRRRPCKGVTEATSPPPARRRLVVPKVSALAHCAANDARAINLAGRQRQEDSVLKPAADSILVRRETKMCVLRVSRAQLLVFLDRPGQNIRSDVPTSRVMATRDSRSRGRLGSPRGYGSGETGTPVPGLTACCRAAAACERAPSLSIIVRSSFRMVASGRSLNQRTHFRSCLGQVCELLGKGETLARVERLKKKYTGSIGVLLQAAASRSIERRLRRSAPKVSASPTMPTRSVARAGSNRFTSRRLSWVLLRGKTATYSLDFQAKVGEPLHHCRAGGTDVHPQEPPNTDDRREMRRKPASLAACPFQRSAIRSRGSVRG